LKIVGLTGGIGSGKSTVARMFAQLGVPVYFADDEAKKLMVTSEPLIAGIKKRFGEKAYDESGLNTRYLAKVVFNDQESLKALNQMVHPAVEKHFKDWVGKQDTAYVIQENPLLFEKNKQDQYDRIVVVAAPTEMRINRVRARDGATRSEVEARIQNQMDQNYKVKYADYVIENDGDLSSCRQAVHAIHKNILSEIP
jgi:dephospho-CoA kinase